METFELRYFLGVAASENLHTAALKLHVSPPSLSKAIARLEEETGVPLFERVGRRIRLTAAGHLLVERASSLINIEESTKRDLALLRGKFHLRVGGPEPLLSFANEPEFLGRLAGATELKFNYLLITETEAVERLRASELDVAFLSATGPSDLKSFKVGQTTFVTCVGPGHPLYARAKRQVVIPVQEVLTHPFAAPGGNLYGDKLPAEASPDGWRDDKFPRQIVHITPSLFLLSRMVMEGKSLAYLPDYVATQLGALELKISGCPFYCKQQIHAVLRPGLQFPRRSPPK